MLQYSHQISHWCKETKVNVTYFIFRILQKAFLRVCINTDFKLSSQSLFFSSVSVSHKGKKWQFFLILLTDIIVKEPAPVLYYVTKPELTINIQNKISEPVQSHLWNRNWLYNLLAVSLLLFFYYLLQISSEHNFQNASWSVNWNLIIRICLYHHN